MIVLVIADPTDLAASRAAEIVLGPNIEIKVASFDDLTVVLDQRLAGDNAETSRRCGRRSAAARG